MAQNRTGLTDLLFGGLLIGATVFLVALPGWCAPVYMGTAAGTATQVRHQVTAVPATALDAIGDPDETDSGVADAGRTLSFQVTRTARNGAHLVSWQRPEVASVARFLERAGRLACPSTAPPRSFA